MRLVLGLTATQLSTLINDFTALWLSGSAEKGQSFSLLGCVVAYPLWEGAVSHLFYAQRLYQLPLGVLGISLATAIYPVMSTDAAKKDFDALIKTISRGTGCALFVAIPATAGIFLVARPLICVLFQHGSFTSADTSVVAWTLSFYAAGLSGYFLQQIMTRALYSLQDSKTPALSAGAAVLANLTLNLTLIWFMGTGGLAAATALCSYLQVAILLVVLRRRLGHSILDGLRPAMVKTIIATAVMCAAGVMILILMSGLPAGRFYELLRLAVVVPTAAGVYLLVARVLRIEMLSLLTSGKGH